MACRNLCEHRSLSCTKATVRMMSLVGLCGVMIFGTSLAGAQSNRNVLHRAQSVLATRFVKALQPAASVFPNVIKNLDRLPASATAAQVYAVVRPVAPLVAQIQRILPPSARSLEGLGDPTISPWSGNSGDCNDPPLARTTSQRARLIMGGTSYTSGVQLTTSEFGNASLVSRDVYIWHLGGQFAAFTASVGLDAKSLDPVTLAILGAAGTPVSFTADGQQVTSTTLYAGVPSKVTFNTAHVENLQLQLTVSEGPNAYCQYGAVVDVANDSLAL